jgi:glutaredoxin-related protein
MSRFTLQQTRIAAGALAAMAAYHRATIEEVATAIDAHRVVVVGMAQNPYVKKVRRLLDTQGITFHYLEYGSYLSMWKPRLAIKMWSGWPTFPHVFVDGVLIGGCAETEAAVSSGQLAKA